MGKLKRHTHTVHRIISHGYENKYTYTDGVLCIAEHSFTDKCTNTQSVDVCMWFRLTIQAQQAHGYYYNCYSKLNFGQGSK